MFRYPDNFNRQKITKIFITHLHLDHCAGLSTLVSFLTNSECSDDSQRLDNTRPPSYSLDIYGPQHLSSMLKPLLFYSGTSVNYAVRIHEFLPTDAVLDGTFLSLPPLKTPPMWMSQISPLSRFIPTLTAVGPALTSSCFPPVIRRISRESFVRGS